MNCLFAKLQVERKQSRVSWENINFSLLSFFFLAEKAHSVELDGLARVMSFFFAGEGGAFSMWSGISSSFFFGRVEVAMIG